MHNHLKVSTVHHHPRGVYSQGGVFRYESDREVRRIFSFGFEVHNFDIFWVDNFAQYLFGLQDSGSHLFYFFKIKNMS